MRARSTGLGKTELILEPENLTMKDGCLFFSLRTTEPVNWRIRVLIERRDLRKLLLLILKGTPLIWLFLNILQKTRGTPIDY